MPMRNCQHPMCRVKVELPSRYCTEHMGYHDKEYNKHVRTNDFNRKYDEFYHSTPWLKQRRHKLMVQPLCEVCLRSGRMTTADMVHHKEELRSPNGWEKRLDLDNLESICYTCHNKEEHRYSWKNRGKIKN